MLENRIHNAYLDRLGPDEVYPGLTEREATEAALAERRYTSRLPTIKSAKIIVGSGAAQTVFNCLILDESPSGVLIDLGTLIILPAEVTLQMNGGGTFLARRCWGVGTRAGLEFMGGQLISADTALRMQKVADILENQGVGAAVGTLRSARYFDHVDLRRAADELELAYSRLEGILTGRRPM